jgi:N-hydroxyarylamine O-acetyltransferase
MDLGSYFARIGYQESRAVSLETLNAIVSAHVRTIPFENLAVLLGEPISLAIADVTEKLVYRRYGGYCFEHNTLLLHVLEELGFSVTALSARSRYQWPERYSLPRTHMCLRVDLGRRTFLVDGGFGGLSPTAALEIVADVEQQTPHEPRRFVREGHWEALALRGPDAVIIHQAHLGDAWHDLYELTLEPMPPVDREMGNFPFSKQVDGSPRDRAWAPHTREPRAHTSLPEQFDRNAHPHDARRAVRGSVARIRDPTRPRNKTRMCRTGRARIVSAVPDPNLGRSVTCGPPST